MRASRFICTVALAVAGLGLLASPASAAPSWVVSLSNEPTSLPRSDERMVYVASVKNDGTNASSGPVTLTVELPGGSDTSVFNIRTPPAPDEGEANTSHSEDVSGWTCSPTQPSSLAHASVTCERADPLAAGASYPPVAVVVHLGQDSEAPIGTARAAVSGGGAVAAATATAQYTFNPLAPTDVFAPLPGSFEIKVSEKNGTPYTKAGGHPFLAYTTFGFTAHRVVDGEVLPLGNIKDTLVDSSRGFVGNALSTPELCQTIEEVILGTCPPRSAVGGTDAYTSPPEFPAHNIYPNDVPSAAFNARPIYSIEPEFGEPAQFGFGFLLGQVPYTFVPEVRADEGYAITFRTAPIVMYPPLLGANVTLCDFGAKLKTGLPFPDGTLFDGCQRPTSPEAYPQPLITNPTRCAGGAPAGGLRIDSWQHPAEVKTAETTLPPFTECEDVKFEPESKLLPTNHEAETPTGLAVELKMPIGGVLENEGVSQANLDNATVTLPKGMSINPAAAGGLGACTLAQVKLHSNAPDECPESSRVGSIEIETPLVRSALHGSIYLAAQKDNPFNSNVGLYMIFSSPRDGLTVKIAGRVEPDPVTGQLVSKFTENPEWPFSRLALHFKDGPRAPLMNPPKCGTYAIHAEFSPWSASSPANPTPAEIVSEDSTYEVSSGPNGSPCPSGALSPKLSAGLKSTQAGSKSPFLVSLSRNDGSQRFRSLSVTTPPGLTAYLRGIPYCSDATLAGISEVEGKGRPELASPACPADSQVGVAAAGAGAGPFPFYVPGRAYLAGPYRGAPLSLAVVTPAVAGPFDLGNVVVRNALRVDPVTSQVTTESDPIPTRLHGLDLDVRDIRVNLNRPGFTAAPTDCEPMAVDARVNGETGGSAELSNRFQVGGCGKLGFAPKLSMRLFGGTHRGSHPRLRAQLTMPEGNAGISRVSVALPHSEFLDQGHIKTVCTRVQFAAHECPPGSIYGVAEATSPLVDYTLTGPVYLRSSNHKLPDLVLALKGPASQPIEIDLDGRVDSIHGGIRTTFESVPDQPVSRFTLRMQGGKKGLLQNSRNICAGAARATAKFSAQNGRVRTLRPKMRSACKKARRHHAGSRHHRR